jgi:2-keto-4-pentenoate hydratase
MTRNSVSPRALSLATEICALLNEELSKPNLVVTDAMIATVINLCGVEVVCDFRVS